MRIIEALCNTTPLMYKEVFDYHHYMYPDSKEYKDYMRAIKNRKVLVTFRFEDEGIAEIGILHEKTWSILLVIDKKKGSRGKEMCVSNIYLSSSDHNGYRRFNSHASIKNDLSNKRNIDHFTCLPLLKICYDTERYFL